MASTISKIDISIVIPMYNAELYILATIHSILLQQSHTLQFEIIIVDDKSLDNSIDIIKKINDPRIHLVLLEKNSGTAHARNAGLKIAQGKWVQFLDSDDSVTTNLFQRFENLVSDNYNCYVFSIENYYPDYILRQEINKVPDIRIFGLYSSIWNKIILKDLCLQFKPAYSFEDTIYVIDMMNSNRLKIALISDAYYLYNRKNPESKMANFDYDGYQKMLKYVYAQIDKSNTLTKKFICETFVGIIFSDFVPKKLSLTMAAKVSLRLFWYIPSVFLNGIRHCVTSTKEKYPSPPITISE